jgi:hypothetical protein
VVTEPIIVSYSELDTFRQCPLKHFLGYEMRYTGEKKEGGALDKGSQWHRIMEVHYTCIMEYQLKYGKRARKIPPSMTGEVLEECRRRVNPLLADPRNGDQTDVQELMEWMYDGHVKMWGIDEDWTILGVEHQIITPLRDQRGRRSRYHLKAKMDLLVFVRSLGVRVVVDHKSGANLPTQMDLEIDDQFGLYTWAMNEVGKPVAMSLHNAARTQRNKSPMTLESRMSRTYLNRDKTELRNLALDAYWAARAAHPPARVERARYSSPDPRTCGWKCDFKEPHLIMRKGRDMHEVMTEYGFKIDRTRH